MTGLVLAIDQGTHATRAMIFRDSGRCLAEASIPVGIHRSDGRVEQDPRELVESVRAAALQAIKAAPGGEIDAAGLATQRSTIVCWDAATAEPLTPAISWQDTRGKAHVRELVDSGLASRVRAITGLLPSAHYGASKLRWCLEHVAAVRDAAASGTLCFGPLASYLVAALTGGCGLADPANAGRTLLFDFRAGDWSAEMLEFFGIDRAWLPQCVPSRADFGLMSLGDRRVPLRVCTGDQSAVPFANGRPEPGAGF
ncbi:MAG: FGGY family carbohydrate kinase, partial [Xanthomonadales bacterium]|nr:FGGY family carbohydrate kinase [Xanthomonadales bacterium]